MYILSNLLHKNICKVISSFGAAGSTVAQSAGQGGKALARGVNLPPCCFRTAWAGRFGEAA